MFACDIIENNRLASHEGLGRLLFLRIGKGGGAVEISDTLSIMIAFGTLIVLMMSHNEKK